jgi:hypothetical protein
VTTLPPRVVTLYASTGTVVTSKVTTVTTLITFLYFLKKWKKWRERGKVDYSITEVKKKQPIGVVTIVTVDITLFHIDG